jgi:hypothetical protein
MSRLRFNDGVEIDTSGPLRVIKLQDGWYVVGQGMSVPCRDKMDATVALEDLQRGAAEQPPAGRWFVLIALVSIAVLLLLCVLSAGAGGAQVSTETPLRGGVAELKVANTTQRILHVTLGLYRDATPPGQPVTLGKLVGTLISPSAFTLKPGDVQTVRLRVREYVAPRELLRLSTLFTPHEADVPPDSASGLRILMRTRVVTKVRAVP